MSEHVIYLETGSQDPAYNLAFEEYLLKNKGEGNILMLWQNANTVVVGLNQNTAEEIAAQEEALKPVPAPSLENRVEVLESTTDDMILLMADLIGGE